MSASYKGYRVGSIEKGLLQLLLGVKNKELPYQGKFESSYRDIFTSARQKAGFSLTFRKLKEKDLIQFQNRDGCLTASLTKKGEKFVEENIFEKAEQQSPKKWDGKWRVVIFDIPEKRRVARTMLRSRLKKYGFRQVQASVWAYPFPCESIVTLIKTYFKLGDEVLYLIVESLEGDSQLRSKFKLPD